MSAAMGVVANQRARMCGAMIEGWREEGMAGEPQKTGVAAGRSLYRPLRRGRRAADGMSAEEVAADQRARLMGAMIEVVATSGYAAATTRELARVASISKQDMYRWFPSKESYFLSTYDEIVRQATERVGTAYPGDGDWKARLGRAFRELAAEVVEQPKAARLALAEVLGAGPAGLARMDATRELFEGMVGACLAQAGDGVALPPLVVKGIIRGVERVIRQRLLSGRERELPELADELLEWALSYRSPAAAQLRGLAAGAGSPALSSRARNRDERVRFLRVAAGIAAERGYAGLTPALVAVHADVCESRVRELCGDRQECFLDALELLGLEALVCTAQAAQGAGDRVVGVHRGIAALVQRIACDRALCRIAFVEIFALGPPGIARREALLGRFTDMLTSSLPQQSRPSPLIAEAIVGAIWGVVNHQIARGEPRMLPRLAGQISYLALAPTVGAERAIHTIVTESQAVSVGVAEPREALLSIA